MSTHSQEEDGAIVAKRRSVTVRARDGKRGFREAGSARTSWRACACVRVSEVQVDGDFEASCYCALVDMSTVDSDASGSSRGRGRGGI